MDIIANKETICNSGPAYYSTGLKECVLRPTNHCTACGKPDWCMDFVNPSGQIEAHLCHRVPSAMESKTGNSWIHFTNQNTEYIPRKISRGTTQPRRKSRRRSCPETTNKVLKALWDITSLSDRHKADLLARGIKDLSQYRSYPEGKALQEVNKTMRERFARSELRKVAGWKIASDGSLYLSRFAGLLIPCCDAAGRFIGAQIRMDSDTKSKYIWLSNSDRKAVTSGTPIHIAPPPT